MQSVFSKITAFFTGIIIFMAGLFGLNGSSDEPSQFIKARYPEYFAARTALAEIPGLGEGFVPQGVTCLDEDDAYLLCGYMDDGVSASRLYVFHDDSVSGLTLLKTNGEEYTGHAGGLTAAGDYVYLSNNKRLYVLNKQAVLSAEDGDRVSFIGSVGVPCNASFCSSDGERVYVGEFHKDKNYETDPSHELTAPDGTVNKALVFAYALSSEGRFGLADTPCAAYSVCDSVQGFALLPGGTAVLSCSYGSSDSQLWSYDCSGAPDGEFDLDGANVPLYYLTSARQSAGIRIPCRSEDLECRGGDLYTVFESGARKFDSRFKSPFIETRIVKLSVDALPA